MSNDAPSSEVPALHLQSLFDPGLLATSPVESGSTSRSHAPLSSTSACEESSDCESTTLTSSYVEIESPQQFPSKGDDTLNGDASRVQSGSFASLFSPLGSDPNKGLSDEDAETKLLEIFDNLDWYRLTLDKFKSGSSAANKQAVKLLELLQKMMDHPSFTNHKSRHKFIVAMERLVRVCGNYLAPYDLGAITCKEKNFIARGGQGDVYRKKFYGQLVAVKVIKPTGADAEGLRKLRKKFAREAVLWRQLSHPNVLPFYGLSSSTDWPFLVSPWMENGHVKWFLRQKPFFNRCLLVTDITRGLFYLHSLHIVHGDLKGINILVDASNRARLIDFGISSVVDSSIPHWTSQSAPASRGGTGHWQAPELLIGRDRKDRAPNTKASDIWAWACVGYEIYTGKEPFHEFTEPELGLKAIQGTLSTPSRPEDGSPAWKVWGLLPSFWALMEECWVKNPDERPTIDSLSSIMESRVKEDPRPESPTFQCTASSSWFGSRRKTLKPLNNYCNRIYQLLREEGLIEQMEATARPLNEKQIDESRPSH